MEILVTIKSYFTEYEKELLEQAAKEQNISISKLVKKQCEPITNPTYKSLDALLDIEKASGLSKLYRNGTIFPPI